MTSEEDLTAAAEAFLKHQRGQVAEGGGSDLGEVTATQHQMTPLWESQPGPDGEGGEPPLPASPHHAGWLQQVSVPSWTCI